MCVYPGIVGDPVRVAIVAGPDAGHAFPAFALAERLVAEGISATVWTGTSWFALAESRGIDIAELPGLAAEDDDDDTDAGRKLSVRAARMAVALAPVLAVRGVDLVISDVITVAGLWAAELCGIPAVELSPHPLYLPSRGLPPVGAGLEPGTGLLGHLRDTALRAASNTSVRAGRRQRGAARRSIGLPADPPTYRPRLIATLPALEVPRPDWPADAHLVGPLVWEPTAEIIEPPSGDAPLIVIAPSTAQIGADMVGATMDAVRDRAAHSPVRVVISALHPPSAELLATAPGLSVRAGLGRQDRLLERADAVVCGGGHGMLAKSLSAGVPVVTVPGGGDQWELATRVTRQGGGLVVRPVDAEAIGRAVGAVLDDPAHREAAARAGASAVDVVDPVRVVRTVHQRYLASREPTEGADECD